MQTGQDGQGEIQTRVGVAVVRELLAALVRKGLAVAPYAGEEAVAGALENEVGPVPGPGLCVRERARVDEVDQVEAEVAPGLTSGPRRKLAIVIGGSHPHVPHEDGEQDHHGERADGAAELEFARVVDLGILPRLPAVDHVGVAGDAFGFDYGLGAIHLAIGMAVAAVTVGCDTVGLGAVAGEPDLSLLVHDLGELGGAAAGWRSDGLRGGT